MESQRSGLEEGWQDPAFEKHYSVLEVAKLWSLSENTVRRMFMGEPGVVEWGSEEDAVQESI